MSAPHPSEIAEWSLEAIFSERLRFEHELIGQRMTWLMALNSFIVGGSAVLAASADRFENTYVLTGAALLFAVLGILSNASCLFSNYRATKSIHASGLALDRHWAKLPPDERERRRANMGLFGRDPRLVHQRGAPAPSQILHPWLLLPTMFLLFFIGMPYISAAISAADRDIAAGWCVLAEVSVLAPFFILPALDLRHYRRTGPAVDLADFGTPQQIETAKST
jgi:hypothetical protein